MEQHQSDQAYHLRTDRWYHPRTCNSAGICDLHSRWSVRRCSPWNCPASGVLPGNELSVPHGKRPENKHEIRCCTLSSGKCTLSTGSCYLQPSVPDHADFFREYKYFRCHSTKRCCRSPQKPSDEHCFQPGWRTCKRKLYRYPCMGYHLRYCTEGRKRNNQDRHRKHFRCNFHSSKMDHQPRSIRYHGPDLHNHLRAGTWRTLKLWPSDLCTGWNHAVCSTCTESDRYFYLHTPESISAGSSLPERQWSHRILHKKLCSQHSGKHGAL